MVRSRIQPKPRQKHRAQSSGTSGTMRALLLPDGEARCKMRRLIPRRTQSMSYWQKQSVAGMAALLAAAATCFGQVSNGTSITPVVKSTDREGRIVVSDQQAVDSGIVGPTAIDRQNLAPAIKERLQRFEIPRDAYLLEQQQLRRRLNGATTEAERERVRALIKEQRDAWLRRTRELRAQSKDRIAELRRQMPSKSEVLDAARENAREAIKDLRKRRGQD